MWRLIYPAVLLSVALVFVACDLVSTIRSASAQDGTPVIVTMNEGSVRTLSDGRTVLEYVEKLEESRCPKGAECVQAGEARVHLKLKPARGEAIDFTLTIPGFVTASTKNGHQPVDVNNHRFTLMELNPYPDARRNAGGRSSATIRIESGQRSR